MCKYVHVRESPNFKPTATADAIAKSFDSGKTFFDISINSGHICMGFEADTPEQWQHQAHRMRLSDK